MSVPGHRQRRPHGGSPKQSDRYLEEAGGDPFAYLRDIFERISSYPKSRLAELLTDQWRAGRQSATTS